MRKKNKTQLSLIIIFLFNSLLFSVYARDRLNTKSITPRQIFLKEDSIKIKECFIATDSLSERIVKLDSSVVKLKNELKDLKKESKKYMIRLAKVQFLVLVCILILERIFKFLYDSWYDRRIRKTLSNALNKEVEDTLIKCCQIVECQALKRVTKASLPNNAKKYMMESYSKVEKDYKKLTSLTNIYNDFDRIQKHQDKAVEYIVERNKEEGLRAQGNAVAFILNKLEGMNKEFKKIKEPLGEGLAIRSDLILNRPSEVSYSVIGVLFYLHKANVDKIIKKEEMKTILDKVILEWFKEERLDKTKEELFRDVMTYLEERNNDNLWFKDEFFEKFKKTEWLKGDFKEEIDELLNN